MPAGLPLWDLAGAKAALRLIHLQAGTEVPHSSLTCPQRSFQQEAAAGVEGRRSPTWHPESQASPAASTHVLSWSPQTEAQKLREAPPVSPGLSALLPPAGPFIERNTNVKNALVESLRRLFTEQVHEVPRGRA